MFSTNRTPEYRRLDALKVFASRNGFQQPQSLASVRKAKGHGRDLPAPSLHHIVPDAPSRIGLLNGGASYEVANVVVLWTGHVAMDLADRRPVN